MGSEDNKNVYSNLVGSDINITCTIRDKWSESLNDEVSLIAVQSAFKNAKKFSPTVLHIITNSSSYIEGQ